MAIEQSRFLVALLLWRNLFKIHDMHAFKGPRSHTVLAVLARQLESIKSMKPLHLILHVAVYPFCALGHVKRARDQLKQSYVDGCAFVPRNKQL